MKTTYVFQQLSYSADVKRPFIVSFIRRRPTTRINSERKSNLLGNQSVFDHSRNIGFIPFFVIIQNTLSINKFRND